MDGKDDEKKNKTQDNFKPFIDIEYNKLITYYSPGALKTFAVIGPNKLSK
jgi:hypothetical protein